LLLTFLREQKMNTLLSWFKQPTTVAGFSALVGTAMGFATGSMTLPTALSVAVGSLVAMALPDNTAAVQASKTATSDLVTLGESILTKPAATTTTTTTTTPTTGS
jgi:hypothetical protein